ncbi:hypothetical protein H696_01272 [Fonticula alba]|uniref:Uncharacterized protein n=1 Tax=Fonticula alba TaxID=691883 RepID=A0A058ZBT8_FONAL|nr:hypothetical protein H696_01272 [Fonticula alba]KCV71859.1 hypothetical protein H696_01272 [Fonticula alba]|eukprot:XP_009493437.1 hypothetical protein H696_01272 [Fonticula alba]
MESSLDHACNFSSRLFLDQLRYEYGSNLLPPALSGQAPFLGSPQPSCSFHGVHLPDLYSFALWDSLSGGSASVTSPLPAAMAVGMLPVPDHVSLDHIMLLGALRLQASGQPVLATRAGAEVAGVAGDVEILSPVGAGQPPHTVRPDGRPAQAAFGSGSTGDSTGSRLGGQGSSSAATVVPVREPGVPLVGPATAQALGQWHFPDRYPGPAADFPYSDFVLASGRRSSRSAAEAAAARQRSAAARQRSAAATGADATDGTGAPAAADVDDPEEAPRPPEPEHRPGGVQPDARAAWDGRVSNRPPIRPAGRPARPSSPPPGSLPRLAAGPARRTPAPSMSCPSCRSTKRRTTFHGPAPR